MKTTSTLFRSLGLFLLLSVSNVYADIALESDSQIRGTWRLEFSKKNQESTKVTERSDTWVIEGGILLMKGIPHADGHPYDAQPVKYVVEDGLFKVALGRPGRFDNYSLVSRTDDTMVLKDKMGVLYHFKKK
jgi:hypothetical protein